MTDASEFEVTVEVPGVAEEGTEDAEKGKNEYGLDLGDDGGLGHGQKAKV